MLKAIGTTGLLVLLSTTAAAKSSRVLNYPYEPVWSAAIRLIRVDGRYRITDKDKDTGYVLFVYPGTGAVKACPASLELVRTGKAPDESAVRVALDIAHQPSYVEVDLLDRLEKKLETELGEPRERKPATPKAPKAPKD